MTISNEAVGAAAKAWVSSHAQPGSWTLEENLRAALEAAAPHILAGAWECAYAQGIEDERMSATSGTDYGPNQNNPYRPTP